MRNWSLAYRAVSRSLSMETSSMREEGLEPSRLAAQEPKSCVSANSTTLAILRPVGCSATTQAA